MGLWAPLSQQRGQQVSKGRTRQAPTGGWNARDPSAQMQVGDALELDNWFPRHRDLVSRPGATTTCETGTVGAVRRLIEFERLNVQKLIAAGDGKLFDVSGSSPSVIGEGFGSDYWAHTIISHHLILANGVDLVQKYDGTTLSPAAYTKHADVVADLDLTKMIFAHVHGGRIYLIEKDSQVMWYGANPQTIGGDLYRFDFKTVDSFKGTLFATMSITRDGGDGPDDYLVALFSSGDCAVYAGTNPSDADNFRKIGSFNIGRPLSRFGFIDTGADVVAITERGYESVTVSIPFGNTTPKSKILSNKIQDVVLEATSRVDVNDGWSLAYHKSQAMLIVNVPQGSSFVQHVQNFDTKAWCRFTGLNASAWARKGSKMYLSTTSGSIKRFDGVNDDGRPIAVNALTAWDRFDSDWAIKHHKLQEHILNSVEMPDIYASMGSDFAAIPIGPTAQVPEQDAPAYWGVARWDDAFWTQENTTQKIMTGCETLGGVSALRLYALVQRAPLAWTSTKYIYENGGLL